MAHLVATLKKWCLSKTSSTPMIGIVLVVGFVMLTGNLSLFSKILAIYPLSLRNLPFLLSLATFFTLLTTMFFLLVNQHKIGRWLIALLLIVTALSAYYSDQYGVLINTEMIDNIVHTDTKEIAGLLNVGLLLRTFFLGIFPAWLVIQYWPIIASETFAIQYRLKWMAILLVLLITIVLPFTADYSSFIREHKVTRLYANPTYPVYSLFNYLATQIKSDKPTVLRKTAADAKYVGHHTRQQLMILVIGETARADRFSLNGYARETNPELSKQNVVSFKNVSSCGTSTGVSVPCMFSSLGRKNYDKDKALAQENVLDVLKNNGVEVLWRDNNSDSKGVATRVQYEDFKTPKRNPSCEGECRDIGMLSGLAHYIAEKKNKNFLIVFHQMGNHGPEYFKRYPNAFQFFKPECTTGELRDCKQNEIDNSYDNAILYTDYFLSEVIEFLKKYDADYETAMLYVSDHGESLGEHGVYLHAAPYAIAPKEQTHVPAIIWLGQHFDYKTNQLKAYENIALSHDDLFCSLLISYQLETKMCGEKRKVWMGVLNH